MDILPFMVICGGLFAVLAMAVFAFSGPSTARATSRRLDAVRERHSDDGVIAVAHRARISAHNQTSKSDRAAMRILPNVDVEGEQLVRPHLQQPAPGRHRAATTDEDELVNA